MFITQQIIKVAMGNVQHCANLTVQQDEYLNTVITALKIVALVKFILRGYNWKRNFPAARN